MTAVQGLPYPGDNAAESSRPEPVPANDLYSMGCDSNEQRPFVQTGLGIPILKPPSTQPIRRLRRGKRFAAMLRGIPERGGL